MSSLIQFFTNGSSIRLCTMTTPPSPRLLSSFKIMFSSNNSSLASQSHVFQYRSLRHLTPPYPPHKLLYLSCWWTGDSTDFWGGSLETTSPQYSEPLSSHCRRSNGECTMAPMTQWREQCRMARLMAIHPHMPELTPAPLAPPEPLPLPNPCLLQILLSILLPRWPDEPTPSLAIPEPPPFPQGNNIVATLRQLNAAGEGLTGEVLLEWALDMLCSPEDWRWLWSLEPTTTSSPSLTLNQLPPSWYNVSSTIPLNTPTPNALNMYAPSVGLPLPVTPNIPASCVPAQSVESSVMWTPVA